MRSKAPRPRRAVGKAELASGDIARRAFDSALLIERAETLEDLQRVTGKVIGSIGFSHWAFTESRGADLRLVTGTPPPLWWPHFLQRGYPRDDIVCLTARHIPDAFYFSDVTGRPGLTAQQRRIDHERREAGVLEGFMSPTHFRDGAVTCVVMSGEDADADDPEARVAAHVLAAYVTAAVVRLKAPRTLVTAPVRLTPRQLECLRWVRDGKSANDIGAILGISTFTAREHITNACVRLGVRTRIQAVVGAFARGLIES